MIQPLKKAVILAAGLGTRFLPITKVIPKAMLPILNKPVIQHLVEEAVASGITEIIIVTGLGKRTIEEYFDPSYELEHDGVHFSFVHQNEARGDGHALLCARDLLEGEPFAVLFGDDIIDSERPALAQLLDLYKETGAPVLCTEKIPPERISNYGVITPKPMQGGSRKSMVVVDLVEKPSPEKAPSNFGVIGKYICTPMVLEALSRSQSSQADGETRLIDGLRTLLAEGQTLVALEVEGTRYDTGTPWGLLEANLAFAKKDAELREKLETHS